MIFTDRSRQDSEHRCRRQRYLQYHAVNGFGVTSKSTQIPLGTGIYEHLAQQRVMETLQKLGSKWVTFPLTPTARKQIRGFIKEATDAYKAEVRAGGFYNRPESEVEDTLAEQCCLIEGLTWGWAKVMLPVVVKEFELIAVEQEEDIVLGCTCGKGREASYVDHAPDCEGVCQQSRPDFAAKALTGPFAGQFGVHDFKTGAGLDEKEVDRYRTSVQMAVGTVGVERRLKQPVTHYYIHHMLKGSRRKMYSGQNRETGGGMFEGPKQQQSDLCYVSYHPPAPPMKESLSFEGQWYKKIGVWQIDTWQGKPTDWTSSEWLIEQMPPNVLEKNFTLIGPYDRQSYLIKSHLTQVEHNEKRWAESLWAIYDHVQEGGTLEEALDIYVPQSWACDSFFGDKCPMWWICRKDGVDLNNILASDRYQLRVPHHKPELELMEKIAKAAQAKVTKVKGKK